MPFELARLWGGSFMRKACALWREEYAHIEGMYQIHDELCNLEPSPSSLASLHTTLPYSILCLCFAIFLVWHVHEVDGAIFIDISNLLT